MLNKNHPGVKSSRNYLYRIHCAHTNARGCKLTAGLGRNNFSAVAWSKLAMMSFCVYAMCPSSRNPTLVRILTVVVAVNTHTHKHTNTHTHRWGANIWDSRSRATTHTQYKWPRSETSQSGRPIRVLYCIIMTSRVNSCTCKCNTSPALVAFGKYSVFPYYHSNGIKHS